MTFSASRARFLRGHFGEIGLLQPPPWALEGAAFTDSCSRCGDCLRACPEKILAKGHGGFPHVDFSKGECTFCGECVDHCNDGALLRGDSPWQLKAHVSSACLARQGVVCISCKEQCPAAAIRMRPRAGGVSLPEIDHERCTGCGACYHPCPVNAIELHPLEDSER